MVLEGSAERAQNLFCVDSVSLDIADDTESSDSDTEEVISETNLVHCHVEASPSAQRPSPTIPSSVEPTLRNFPRILGATDHTLTQREWATVLAASVLLTSDCREENEMLGLRALLIHTIILSECELENRVYDPKHRRPGELLLVKYVEVFRSVITSQLWHEVMRTRPLTCDVADLIDGRLFLEMMQLQIICPSDLECSFSQSVVDRFSLLASLVKGICGVEIASFQVRAKTSGSKASSNKKTRSSGRCQVFSRTKATAVLPFDNPDFDSHLKPISLAIDKSAAGKELAVSRIFQEISHWHNHRRLLGQRNAIPPSEWLLRRNQKFMAETEQYAASLTDAKPESIFVKTNLKVLPRKNPASEAMERDRTSLSTKNGPKQTRQPKASASASVKAEAEVHFREQREKNLERQLKAWKAKRHGIEHADNLVQRYQDASEYLHSLKRKGDCLIELDILAYLIMTLAQLWKTKCETEKNKPMGIVALIWFLILKISKAKQGITIGIRCFVEETIKALNLPRIDIPCHSSGKATSSFTPIPSQHANLQTGLSQVEFQLVHAGPYFDRNMESAPDPRVHDFEPDRWQRDILDQIDAKASLFVVAPTSAGKTFIS